MTQNEEKTGFISHLVELRERLIHCLIFLFVAFIILSSFTVLNLFIAIIIDSMQTLNEGKQTGETSETEVNKRYTSEEHKEELRTIRREIEELKRLIINPPR